MAAWVKYLIFFIGLLYIISPYDFFPDIFPIFGRVDDLLVLGIVAYVYIVGRLPRIFGRLQQTMEKDDQRRRAEGPEAPPDDSVIYDPYETLGIEKDATPREIKMAYRKASQLYHPDKVLHLGPDLQKLAQEKFVKIQESYEYLKEKGGW